ncbi:MAG: mechanosensitive ion channel family protein [Rhodothermales bacterium]
MDPLPQQAPLAQIPPADSLAADTSQVVDTTNTISSIGDRVGDAGRLLISGEYELFADRLYAGFADLIVGLIPKLLLAVFVFVLFYGLYRSVYSLLQNVLHRSRRVDAGLEKLSMKTYKVVGSLFVGLMVLDQLNVNIVTVLTAFGIAGIAIGFAARDTLENYISGITILLDKPFRIGDNIRIEDVYGTVDDITLRSTRILTLNNAYLVMPNTQMINQKLINHSILGVVRVEVPFGIAYKEYPQEAREVVLNLVRGDERLHPDYEPSVVVTKLNDSSVDMTLRMHIADPRLEMPVKLEYFEKVREALREADIEIPFPHLQLFVDEAKAFEGSPLLRNDGDVDN